MPVAPQVVPRTHHSYKPPAQAKLAISPPIKIQRWNLESHEKFQHFKD